jgi:hypothetical protein
MICQLCGYELDACCTGPLCCCCAKKEYNKARRSKNETKKKKEEYCHSDSDCSCPDYHPVCEPECQPEWSDWDCQKDYDRCRILIEESLGESSTTGSILVKKVELPIEPECIPETYLIEWYIEASTSTPSADGQAHIVVTLCIEDESPPISEDLAEAKLDVTVDTWVPFTGFAKAGIACPTNIKLSFTSITEIPNSKNICVRNAKITAKRIL